MNYRRLRFSKTLLAPLFSPLPPGVFFKILAFLSSSDRLPPFALTLIAYMHCRMFGLTDRFSSSVHATLSLSRLDGRLRYCTTGLFFPLILPPPLLFSSDFPPLAV